MNLPELGGAGIGEPPPPLLPSVPLLPRSTFVEEPFLLELTVLPAPAVGLILERTRATSLAHFFHSGGPNRGGSIGEFTGLRQ